VQTIHNDNGFIVSGAAMTGNLNAIAVDSLASGNTAHGFLSFSAFGKAATTFTLANSKATNNPTGVSADGNNAAMFLNGSTISGNSVNGFSATNGAAIASYGNNAITDTSNLGSLTPVALR